MSEQQPLLAASPHVCILGVSRLNESAAFWTHLGFTAHAPVPLAQADAQVLFGLEATSTQLLTMADAKQGHLLLVETPHPNPTTSPYNIGPHAIDVYTTDMERSLALAQEAGANTAFGKLDYAFGPVRLVEGKVSGPDGVVLVFVDITRRRPSLLDHFPDRLHSEIHSVVNIVQSVDEANAVWAAAGLTIGADATIDTPELATFLGLAAADRCRMSLLADEQIEPIRLEMLQFLDNAPVPPVVLSTWPLPAGLPLVGFVAADDHLFEGAETPGQNPEHERNTFATLSDRLACSRVDSIGQRYVLIESGF